MPCYQRRTVSVDFSNAQNVDALAAALQKLGALNVSVGANTIDAWDEHGRDLSWTRGRGLRVDSASRFRDATIIKKAYGYEVVARNAKRFGWTVSEQENGQLELARRRY